MEYKVKEIGYLCPQIKHQILQKISCFKISISKLKWFRVSPNVENKSLLPPACLNNRWNPLKMLRNLIAATHPPVLG